MKKKAVILLSGGLDSTTCLAVAKSQDFDCYALSFSYGQKHQSELHQARKIANQMGVLEHRILDLPVDGFRGSSLTDSNLAVDDFDSSLNSIPVTYVPARNTIFLSFALGMCETIGAFDIFIGANAVDYSGYPDCRPDYLRAFETMANLATKASVEKNKVLTIHTPLLTLSKAEIIKLGIKLGVDYAETVSCYRADANGFACGKCDSCVYRKKGFQEAHLDDVTRYT